MLNEVPMRGTGTPMPPTDPLIYRFYELILVNGPAWKALIEEEFGDGIMSAIDFDMDITRKADPKGDRVSIGMTGKFLPYKYYGATGNDDRELRSEGRKIATQALLFTLAAFFFPAPPTSTWPPMSAMRLVPVSAMVTLSSFSRMSIALATPALPPAPSPSI